MVDLLFVQSFKIPFIERQFERNLVEISQVIFGGEHF